MLSGVLAPYSISVPTSGLEQNLLWVVLSSYSYAGQLCSHVNAYEAPLPASHLNHFHPPDPTPRCKRLRSSTLTSLSKLHFTEQWWKMINSVIQFLLLAICFCLMSSFSILQLIIVSKVLLSINMFFSNIIYLSCVPFLVWTALIRSFLSVFHLCPEALLHIGHFYIQV